MDGETFLRRLIHSVAVAISASNNFIPLLNGFIADVLKCKAFLKVKIECVPVTVKSHFSCNLIKTEID